jgi:hypothetical protein
MEIKLNRRLLKDDYTIGSIYIDDKYLCDAIEDKVRDINQDGDLDDEGEGKVFGETAIPYGRYKVDLTISPKFKRVLPLVLNVPHFTGIRIHRGNTAKDSHGCILPGENKSEGKVINSTKYELRIIEEMLIALKNGDNITLTIT